MVPLLFLLPGAMGTIVMTPNYNQGCNLNPYGTLVQYPALGTTYNSLLGPTLGGGYLLPPVAGDQYASSSGGSASSAIQTAEWFMVGPPNLARNNPTCWQSTGAPVSLSASWGITMNPYLGANCSAGSSATASYDVYIVDNFHQNASPWYVITGISPHLTVDAFAIGCSSIPYAPGSHTYTLTVTTPVVTPVNLRWYDFYTAIWVSTQIQIGSTGTPAAYAGVTWNAALNQVVCNGC